MPKMIKNWPKLVLIASAAGAFSYAVYLQFLSPAFCDPDSYYHIAVSDFIRHYGLHYHFGWAQFSIFKDYFSDKDILFHILNLPFLWLAGDPVLAGKCAFMFQAALFIAAYAFILKKYLPDLMAAAFLLLPFTSSTFTAYFLQLRPATTANIIMLLGIYYLINKRPGRVFTASLLYAVTHISFTMLPVFALICESLRRLINKEFFAKNIYAALAGIIAGCILHPDFPDNLFSLFLNGIMVPLYGLAGIDLGFGSEMHALNTDTMFISNFAVFLAGNAALWLAMITKRKLGFASAVWFASAGIYLILGFFGTRYWYPANALFFTALASFASDWTGNSGWLKAVRKAALPLIICLLIGSGFFVLGAKELRAFLRYSYAKSAGLEDTGRWMKKNLPAGQTVYHSYWTDSPYFICLNPKDNYLNVLDPIYMFYFYSREFELLNDLSMGRVDKPHEVMKKVFKAGYGYINKFEPLYRQARDYPQDLQVLYENREGAVLRIR